MSIENEIIRLQNAKASIKTAIEGKGVTVGDDVKLDGYAELIDSITVGSGDGEEHVNPDFYNLKTNNGTDYSYLFNYYNGVNLDYISNWDTSNVTNMKNMFSNSSSLTSLDLSKWNTSKVTNMSNMFNYCGSLTSLDLSNFNTSNVKDMNSMFNYCTKLISVDITGWDTAKVTNMNSMFYGNSNMALIHVYGELDLSGLTNGFYPGSYTAPLKGCKSLETLYLKNIYKNCTMTNAAKWSINLDETCITDKCLIYIINELPDLINDKKLTTTTNIILTLPKTNTLTEEQVKVATDKGWQVANTTYHLPSYTVTYNLGENIICEEKQIVKEGMPFSLTLKVTGSYIINSVTVTMGNTAITPTYTKDSLGLITAAKINITSVTGDITITATTEEAIRQTTFTVGTGLDVNNILCITPTTSDGVEEVIINGKTQTVPDGKGTKNYTVNNGDEIEIVGSFKLIGSTVLSISGVELQENMTNMNEMFYDCKSLTTLDLLNFNTAKVTSMYDMFRYCGSLTALDVTSFNTINVTNMRYMFNGCKSLTALDVINFNTENVTNMKQMFDSCEKLTSLDLSSFNTMKVTDMSNMFYSCKSLTTLDLSSFNTSNVTSFTSMLSSVPSTCTIYINPDTFINKSTGQTFTPAELGWAGTAFTPKYN